jgi:hypothetical protein
MSRIKSWKTRLAEHPVFQELASLCKQLQEVQAPIQRVNEDANTILRTIVKRITEHTKPMSCWGAGRIASTEFCVNINWVQYDGTYPWSDSYSVLSLPVVGRGKVTMSMFPLAYILGCVSNFELLQLSKHKYYGRKLALLLKKFPGKTS